MNSHYKFGVTQIFPCSYLPEKEEKLLIALDPRLKSSNHYELLMSQGFRRSGDQIYRPFCDNCDACQSIRVIANLFKPSKSQKRLLKKNSLLIVVISTTIKANYYDLYEAYINHFHTDGSMYPANKEQYESFLQSENTEQIYIELWDEQKLVSVAVTDVLPHALSAVYTFYHPKYRQYGIGVFSILKQIELTHSYKKEYLYLGYQIDECQKMNYKNRFFPHQRLFENSWHTINK